MLYTDGFPEACNQEGEMLGNGRFNKILQSNRGFQNKDYLYRILEEIKMFKNDAEMDDDMTIISIDVVAEGVSFSEYQLSTLERSEKVMSNNQDISEKFRILNKKYEHAFENYRSGNYHKAKEILIELYEIKFNRKEDNFKVLNLLGHTNYRLNNYQESLKLWEEAIIYSPENKELLRNIKIIIRKLTFLPVY